MWFHINKMQIAGTTRKRYKFLPKVAEVVLVLPHSNADLERLFSIFRKNKTDATSSLKLDGTLSSILAIKLKYPEPVVPCHKFHVWCSMSVVPCHKFHVYCTMSQIPCLLYHVTNAMSVVPCHKFHICCAMSQIPCLLYHVTNCMSVAPCLLYHVCCIMSVVSYLLHHVC